jgi:hypothetical protein
MNSYCVNALLSLVLVLPVTLKTTEPALIALKIERRNWSGKIKPGERIEVDNEWGEVRVRFGGNKGQVEYLAVLQPLTLGTARVTVAAEPITGGLHIVTRVENGALPAGAKDRADLTIFVPKGSPLRVRTLRGLIDISIRTVEGLVKTINQHGTTTVLLERLADHTEQTFESLTGDITVSLPTTAEPMVTIGTSGDICSDVSIVIVHHPHEEPSKIATARVGAGVSSLLIRSKRGNIHLRQREDVRTGSTTVEHPTIDSDD